MRSRNLLECLNSAYRWPSIVLLLGLTLTGVVWHYASIKDEERSLAEFKLHARDASHEVQGALMLILRYCAVAGSFFAGSNSGSPRTEWNHMSTFSKPKEKYPGIDGLGVIRYIPDSQKRGL